jgi:hypothetical protein
MAFAKALATTTSPTPVNFIYVSGEHATTSPGMLTQHWARIKGLAESSLLSLSKEAKYSNLRPISLRPGGVDPKAHTEIHQYLPTMGMAKSGAMVAIRTLLPHMMSPTRELGKVLVDLAMGDGGEVKVEGVEGEGRTVSNAAMRRIAGLDK